MDPDFDRWLALHRQDRDVTFRLLAWIEAEEPDVYRRALTAMEERQTPTMEDR